MDHYTDTLYTIAWRTILVRLRNTRAHGLQPPLAILNAVFKHAAAPLSSLKDHYFFHPCGRLPGQLQAGDDYEIEVVFPAAGEEEISHFAASLAAHLANPRHNFKLLAVSAPRQRNLETLVVETDPSLWETDEVCLDFQTPFAFQPKNPKRRWLIDPEAFFQALTKRLALFYPTDPLPADPPWRHLRLLPYYWHYEEYHRPSASGHGIQWVNGVTGPLYLRGEIRPVLPLLLVCSELHAHGYKGPERGGNLSHGVGYYRLLRERPFFAPLLRNHRRFDTMVATVERSGDEAEELETLLNSPVDLERCFRELSDGSYHPGAAVGFTIPKRQGGQRLLGIFEPRDRLAHKHLHGVLAETMDKMFEEASIGYRCNRSREMAIRMVAEAAGEGLHYVVESDIEAFFSQVDWEVLLTKLRECLPQADTLTLALLERCIKGGLLLRGEAMSRERGLIEGSPLSPLLSNLYLDSFDEEMERRGYRLIRYADDFIVMVRGMEEGEKALADIREILAPLKLALKESKTRITPLDAGITFLGLDLGDNLDEEFIERTMLRKPVFIREQYAFLGTDHDTVVIRKGDQLLDRLPIHRIGEIIVLGANSLSTHLIHKCVTERIPISFCSASGRYLNTIKPDSKAYFEIATRHAARFQTLSEEDHLLIARRVVSAKLHNYLAWFQRRWSAETRELRHRLEWKLSAIAKAETIDEILGYEGKAATLTFHFLNSRIKDKATFTSPGRSKRVDVDRYNTLLNFAYHLLFTRINVLLRGAGLNPYLGVLHSHKDHFESLVCDLQEPFRCRMDRFVVRFANLGRIGPEDFTVSTYGNHYLGGKGVGVFLDAFEREFHTRHAGDGGTLKQLLVGQVRALAAWVNGTLPEPFFYRASTGVAP